MAHGDYNNFVPKEAQEPQEIPSQDEMESIDLPEVQAEVAEKDKEIAENWESNVKEFKGKEDKKLYNRIEQSTEILKSLDLKSLDEGEDKLVSLQNEMEKQLQNYREEMSNKNFMQRLFERNKVDEKYKALETEFNELNKNLGPVRDVLAHGQLPKYKRRGAMYDSEGNLRQAA